MQSEMEQKVFFALNMDQYLGWQEFWPSSFSEFICSASLHRSKKLLVLRSKQALFSLPEDNLVLFDNELSEMQLHNCSG